MTTAPVLLCGFQMTIFVGHYDRGDFRGCGRVFYKEGLNVKLLQSGLKRLIQIKFQLESKAM